MGPYYRQTSQGLGGFFETIYQHPILIILVVAVVGGAGYFFWRKRQND